MKKLVSLLVLLSMVIAVAFSLASCELFLNSNTGDTTANKCPGCNAEGNAHAKCEHCDGYTCVGDHSACGPTTTTPETCPGCNAEGSAHAKCEYCDGYTCVGDHSKCGLPEAPANVEAALAAAAENAGLVTNGEQIFSCAYTSEDYSYTSTETKTYEFGDGYLHIYHAEDESDTYVTLLEDGTVFALRVTSSGDAYVDGDAYDAYLSGPSYSDYYIASTYNTYYGTLDFLTYIYDELTADAEDLTVNADTETLTYSFSFKLNDALIEAEFTLDAQTLILASASITTSPSESYTYSLTCTQQIDEELVVENNHTPDVLLPSSFDMKDPDDNVLVFEDGVCTSTLSLTTGEHFFALENVSPSTAILSLGFDSLTFLDENGDECWAGYGYYSNGGILVSFSNEGSYTLVINMSTGEYKIPVVIAMAASETITPVIYDDDLGYGYTAESTSMYSLDSFVIFYGEVDYGCDPAYTVKVISGDADSIKLVPYTIYSWSGDISAYKLYASTYGTYVIELVYTADTSVTATLTVEYKEPPKAAELAVGKYTDSDEMGLVVNFYPEDETKGFATVAYSEYFEILTYYIYDNDLYFTNTDTESGMFSIYLSTSYEITVSWGYRRVPVAQVNTTPDDFTGVKPEIPDAPAAEDPDAPEQLTPGTSSMSTSVNYADGNYVTTIPAGSVGYFYMELPMDDPAAADIIITFTGDVKLQTSDTGLTFVDAVSGSYVTLTQDDYSFYFCFVNSTDADIDVNFTITCSEREVLEASTSSSRSTAVEYKDGSYITTVASGSKVYFYVELPMEDPAAADIIITFAGDVKLQTSADSLEFVDAVSGSYVTLTQTDYGFYFCFVNEGSDDISVCFSITCREREELSAGTSSNSTSVNYVDGDYVSTVAAGSAGYFYMELPMEDPAAADIIITFTGDVKLQTSDTGLTFVDAVSGCVVTLTQDDYSLYFCFVNDSSDDISVCFSITCVEKEILEAGTSSRSTTVECKDGEYLSGIAAGSAGYFYMELPVDGPEAADITITFTGDVKLQTSATGSEFVDAVSGSYVTLTQDDYSLYFCFVNEGSDDANVSFTITYVEKD